MRNDNFELYYIWNKEIRKIQVVEMYSKIDIIIKFLYK